MYVKKEPDKLVKVEEGRRKVIAIIESMLEETIIDEETVKTDCKYLCKSEYDDVNVERSLIKLCGYPLCCEKVKELPKKKYQISLKEHKVYDLEKRRQFCSDRCLKASNFIRDQLDDSPFWMRTVPPDFQPDINLYQGTKGLKGEAVELGMISHNEIDELLVKVKEIVKSKTKSKVPLSAPYIKEDQLEQLKESMASLKIVEKNVKERDVQSTEAKKYQENFKLRSSCGKSKKNVIKKHQIQNISSKLEQQKMDETGKDN